MRWLLRIFLALSGGAVAALFIALIETRAVLAAMPTPPGFFTALLSELGLIGPVAVFVGAGVGVMSIVVDPEGTPILKRIAFIRAARVRHHQLPGNVRLLRNNVDAAQRHLLPHQLPKGLAKMLRRRGEKIPARPHQMV